MISIIIPNYNGKELLKKNLPFVIDAVKFYNKEYEIIVADDASFNKLLNILNSLVRERGYDLNMKCFEDWDHWLSFAEEGFYGSLLPEPLLYWRRHITGSRNTQSPEVVEEVKQYVKIKHHRLYSPKVQCRDYIRHIIIKIQQNKYLSFKN